MRATPTRALIPGLIDSSTDSQRASFCAGERRTDTHMRLGCREATPRNATLGNRAARLISRLPVQRHALGHRGSVVSAAADNEQIRGSHRKTHIQCVVYLHFATHTPQPIPNKNQTRLRAANCTGIAMRPIAPKHMLVIVAIVMWVIALASESRGHPIAGRYIRRPSIVNQRSRSNDTSNGSTTASPLVVDFGRQPSIAGDDAIRKQSSESNGPSEVRASLADVVAPVNSSYANRRSHVSVELSAIPSDDGEDDDGRETSSRPQNIVKYVTTGSKIVFLDDAQSDSIAALPSSGDQTNGRQQPINRTDEINSSDSESDGTDDSLNEASSHFETFLQAPPPGMTGNARSAQPFESLIVHDSNYQKGGGARPRSVSYSSITQTISTTVADNQTAPDQPRQAKNNAPFSQPEKQYGEPAKTYAQPERIYSEPAKVYSEPAKVYSEPAKIYSEPAKVYSEPAKNYGEPSKVYSEPAKIYSRPAGQEDGQYHDASEPPKAPATTAPNRSTTMRTTTSTTAKAVDSALVQNPASTSFYFGVHNVPPAKRIIFNLDKLPYDLLNAPLSEDNQAKNLLYAPQLDAQRFHQFARNSDGQQFGALPSPDAPPRFRQSAEAEADSSADEDGQSELNDSSSDSTTADYAPDPKVGFVVEGRNYRKYRVEEKTSDGFIVGEYGVVSNNDGSLRGVRYTADSNISPNLIYETLMKFLSL